MLSPMTALLILLSIVGLIAVTVLIRAYRKYGTGFDEYTSPIILVPESRKFQGGKTVWDWMRLFIIPFTLALGAWLFTWTLSENEQVSRTQQATVEAEVATDNRREARLQDYLSQMTELMLENGLQNSVPGDPVRSAARARTLTTVRRLDEERKGILLQFLYESNLITKPIIDLDSADLSDADLHGAILDEAHLSGANLHGADLSGAWLNDAFLISTTLSEANLDEAILEKADLSFADLHGADLDEALLVETNLHRGNLDEADLRGAWLIGTNLSFANLSGADLRMADLSGADLRGAKYNDATTWPDGFIPPADAINVDEQESAGED